MKESPQSAQDTNETLELKKKILEVSQILTKLSNEFSDCTRYQRTKQTNK